LDDIVQEFLVESNENLDRLESELVKLEADPKSSDVLASIFRSIHSIKGACGFLDSTSCRRSPTPAKAC
jgi:two-component system chemotaxis sensor kinase CheA